MARSKKESDKVETQDPSAELVTKIRKRFQVMLDADQRNRDDAIEDMEFVNIPGRQWDENMKIERGDRPCYEFNKLRVTSKRIINDMRANRAAGKVRAVEDNDKETADIYEGLIRNIWNISDGDSIIDNAAEYQVNGGMACWRVNTRYADDTAFDQDLVLEAIPNPFCLYADPGCKDSLKRDAKDWILTERIPKEDYEERYPDAEVIEFDGGAWDDKDEWDDGEHIRVAEYWYKEPVEKELWLLEDGKVIDSTTEEAAKIDQKMIKRRRSIETNQIKMCIVSGNAVLEGPVDWAGSEFPFVMVYGETVIVNGREYWYGLVRFAKDAQRSYNVSRTSITETIAQAPQAKFWATPEQAKGHTGKWAEAHKKNFPFMLYNPDPKTGNRPPQRMGGSEVPVALIQEANMASEEIKAVTGIYDASLGNRSNEQSGRAIYARQQQGEIATFNYGDNMSKGIRRTWEILVDLIPRIYDTERSIRILGSDEAEDYVKINAAGGMDEAGNPVMVNDLSRGKYDVAITMGPNFTTKRQEASEIYLDLTSKNPDVFRLAGDLIFKSMDLPYSEDIAERLKLMLPPEVQQLINEGKELPPEARAMMAQAQQAVQMAQQQMAAVQQAAQEVEVGKVENEKGKAEIEKLIAELQTQKAQFEADVAKKLADVAKRDANVRSAEASYEREADRQGMAELAKQAMAGILDLQNQFTQQAATVLADIQSRPAPERPRIRKLVAERVDGQLQAVAIYDDEPSGTLQ